MTLLHSVRETIDRALDAAGLNRDAGSSTADGVRATIDRALGSAGLMDLPTARPQPRDEPATPDPAGRFTTHLHTSVHGSRTYKLFVPTSYDGTAMPLLLMLHGCTQNPDDFAAGTRLNALAEQHGVLVAWPAQSARANGKACWNWFDAAQQRRGGVELSLLTGIVDDVARSHAVDSARIYAAGLSAGAAMAVLLGREYPDRFAAVASHSGLPAGAAHDVPSAFAAMQGRAPATPAPATPGPAVRTLVIHGDADATVQAQNGAAVVAQAIAAFEREGAMLRRVAEAPAASHAAQRRCSVTRFLDAEDVVAVEHWLVHGAGHAWSGGSSQGTYTDPQGPDASAAMLRFFLRR
jgi:poly(hydroxyalkanoate) depolymerase family esterase